MLIIGNIEMPIIWKCVRLNITDNIPKNQTSILVNAQKFQHTLQFCIGELMKYHLYTLLCVCVCVCTQRSQKRFNITRSSPINLDITFSLSFFDWMIFWFAYGSNFSTMVIFLALTFFFSTATAVDATAVAVVRSHFAELIYCKYQCHFLISIGCARRHNECRWDGSFRIFSYIQNVYSMDSVTRQNSKRNFSVK